MANTTRDARAWTGRHRADEIHVHKRQTLGRFTWLPLLLLVGILIVGLFVWSRYKRDRAFISKPELPRQELPGVPRRQMPAIPPITEIPRPGEAQPDGPSPGAASPTTQIAKCSETTVFFEMNKANLDQEGQASLAQLAECLKANPTQAVRLEGRSADEHGQAERNERLAQQRAGKVADQLAALGVSRSQITVVVAQPLCAEANEGCRQKNRSVTATMPEE